MLTQREITNNKGRSVWIKNDHMLRMANYWLLHPTDMMITMQKRSRPNLVNGHVGDDSKDYADSAGTFQLSGLYGLNDKWSLYLRYSSSRAPPADSVNSGFEI